MPHITYQQCYLRLPTCQSIEQRKMDLASRLSRTVYDRSEGSGRTDRQHDDDNDDEEEYTEEMKVQMNLQLIRRDDKPLYPRDITIRPDATWELLYIGNDNKYECNGIVPASIVSVETNLCVAVSFCYQVLGVDYPRYEHSLISNETYCFTTNNNSTIGINASM